MSSMTGHLPRVNKTLGWFLSTDEKQLRSPNFPKDYSEVCKGLPVAGYGKIN